ncbi:iron-sulfur cluster-binding protein, partial [Blautia sp. MSK22_86]|nr:iron-sulfur cluster-binding protein [Blautia sp. MSK22_86]
IGQGYRGKSGALGVGSCTSGFKYNLKGCPPTDEQMYEFLKQYIATRRKTEAEK